MKKYWKEIIILIIQLLLFYAFPLTAGPTDSIGLVLIIIIVTFVLSLALGIASKEKIKYFYSIIVAVLFIPSVFIYYNETALIHSLWYLVVSTAGLLLGCLIHCLFAKKKS